MGMLGHAPHEHNVGHRLKYAEAVDAAFENDRKEFAALIADEKGEYLDRSSEAARRAVGISPSQTGNVVSLRNY